MSTNDLIRWLEAAPPGTLLDARALLAMLDAEPVPAPAPETTWRERLWTAPAETRLGVAEVAEAVGRSEHWVYRAKTLPRRKMDGELTFTAGDVRAWLGEREETIHAPPARVYPIKQARRIHAD